MKADVRAVAACVAMGLSSTAWSQGITWNFGEGTGNAWPTEDLADFVSGGCVTNGNTVAGGVGAASASAGYAGASGGCNEYVTARSGAFSAGTDGSSFFEVPLLPSVGYALVVTNLAFGTRSTATGPQAFCVRSSLDGYGCDLSGGALACDSEWCRVSLPLAVTSTVAGAAVSLRIYGYNGTGNATVNWRIDDLVLAVRPFAVWDATPPDLAQVSPQTVRAGGVLSFALAITPTEGDPVTYTNAVASDGVQGSWSLIGNVFSYAPHDADCGVRAFTFSVADKDGTNTMAVAVTVRHRTVVAVSLSDASGVYAQDFDALAGSGSANEWDNAAYPLAGWYAFADAAAVIAYRAGSGGDTSGGLYSFGSASASEDRSLGSLAAGEKDYRYGVAFTNATRLALTNVTVSFVAEQWRVGASASTNSLVFEYCVTNRALALTQGVWRRVRSGCFCAQSVTNSAQAPGACYWAEAKRATLGQPVPDGAVLLLRWTDADDAGSDHAFGIDDVGVSWSAGPSPEAIPVGRAGHWESFDEMNTNAVADLPALWRIEACEDALRTTGPYDCAQTCTALANAATNLTRAGAYNFGSSELGDQAVGGLVSGSGAQSVTLFGKFVNAAGLPVRRWSASYAVEKYRNGTVGTSVRLLASTDGRVWLEVGDAVGFAADADTGGISADARPGATITASREAVFGTPILPGGVFYLAWQVSATAGDVAEGAQALGIDDVQIAPRWSSTGALVVVR